MTHREGVTGPRDPGRHILAATDSEQAADLVSPSSLRVGSRVVVSIIGVCYCCPWIRYVAALDMVLDAADNPATAWAALGRIVRWNDPSGGVHVQTTNRRFTVAVETGSR